MKKITELLKIINWKAVISGIIGAVTILVAEYFFN